ncbi:MAG: hypothetical protein ACREF4_22365 [Gammaproteobacteria bacterium]
MVLAGQTIVAGQVPGERVATDIETIDSANVTTTETVVQTVVAPVISGRTYRVRWHGDLASSVAADIFFVKIREDTVAGNTLDFRRYRAHTTDNFPYSTEVEYTADATEDKTFVFTLVRSAGTGNGRLDATSTSPAYLYVNYIRG